MRISKKILDVAFKIGFNYSKEPYNIKAVVSLPCSVTLKNGKIFEKAELFLMDKLNNESNYIFYQIEDVESITESKYALSFEFRKKSLITPEYRNDRPFFIENKNGQIFGYNALGPINFTYKKDIFGKDIKSVIEFNDAQSRGFEFVKNQTKSSVKILCGYDDKLVEKIKNCE